MHSLSAFLYSYLHLIILIYKVSRVFAANLLLKAAKASESKWTHEDMDKMYLVTSDADLWPISRSAYDLPNGVDLLLTDAYSCRKFKRGNEYYQMITMSNIGARFSTWRNITNRLLRQNYFLTVEEKNCSFVD